MPIAGSNSMSTFANVLKKLYAPSVTEAKVYQNNPTFAKIKKIGDWEGDGTYNVPIEYNYGQGVGPTIASAKSNRTADSFERFAVPQRDIYGIGSIDGKLIRNAKSSKGSQAGAALQRARDNNLKTLRRYLQHSLFSNGGGSLAQVGSIPSATTIQLLEPNDVVWFEKGMVIEFSTADGTSGAVKTNSFTVASVNRDTGVITFTANVNGGGGNDPAVNDHMFRFGSFGQVPDGIPVYVPKTAAEAATTKYGVVRANDVTRLAGLRHVTAQGATVKECLLLALARCAREGISPDSCPMHPDDLQAMVLTEQGQVQYTRSAAAGKLEVGFNGESIRVVSPTGLAVDVYPDAGVKKGECWLLTGSSWEYHYAGGGFPELLQDDGVPMLRESDDDTYTWRLGAIGNLVCTAPSENMYVKLPLAGTGME